MKNKKRFSPMIYLLVGLLIGVLIMIPIMAGTATDATPVIVTQAPEADKSDMSIVPVTSADAISLTSAAVLSANQDTVSVLSPPVPEVDWLTSSETELATSDYEIELIARTIWGEAEIVKSKAEQAAVAWCVLNRVDAWGKSIEKAVLTPHQFAPKMTGTVPTYFIDLARDVVERWEAENAGAINVGRVLPKTYLYFIGDGRRNHFSEVFLDTAYWDWSLPDPYAFE